MAVTTTNLQTIGRCRSEIAAIMHFDAHYFDCFGCAINSNRCNKWYSSYAFCSLPQIICILKEKLMEVELWFLVACEGNSENGNSHFIKILFIKKYLKNIAIHFHYSNFVASINKPLPLLPSQLYPQSFNYRQEIKQRNWHSFRSASCD